MISEKHNEYDTLHDTTVRCGGFGPEIETLFEDGKKVVVAQDVYGEIRVKCQTLIYVGDCNDDFAVAVRYNDDGTIAEVALNSKHVTKRKVVYSRDARETARAWLTDRDGR